MTSHLPAELTGKKHAHTFAGIIKECGCGIMFTREQWGQLDLVGQDRSDSAFPYELRNCWCDSTIAVEL